MKFTSSIIAFGLAAQALATPTLVERKATLVQRDIAAFQSVLSSIQDKVDTFDTDVKAYSGGSGDTTKLLGDSKDIVDATNAGVQTLSSQPQLADTDALGLTSPVQDLTKKIQTAISDLIDKKSQLVAAGEGATVESNLQEQYDAAKKLADTITSKVSSNLQSIAASLSAGITDAIQKGIDAFKGTGGSTSTSGGSTATATATASATSQPGSATTAPATTAPATTAPATTPAGSGSAVPTSTGAATSSGVMPGGSPSGTSGTTPPLFTNAASVNKVGAAGVLAGVAALFAL